MATKCSSCGTITVTSIPPLAYIRHVYGKNDADSAVGVDCVCGERLTITAGEARRAA